MHCCLLTSTMKPLNVEALKNPLYLFYLYITDGSCISGHFCFLGAFWLLIKKRKKKSWNPAKAISHPETQLVYIISAAPAPTFRFQYMWHMWIHDNWQDKSEFSFSQCHQFTSISLNVISTKISLKEKKLMHSVLVSSGCYTKNTIDQVAYITNIYFLKFWRLGSPRWRCW